MEEIKTAKTPEQIEDDNLIQLSSSYYQESKQAKITRMELNKQNFDTYHLRQDYSHKVKGQSKEFLAKQAMAVEQIVTFIQQGLIDLGDWFGMEKAPGIEKPLLSSEEARRLVQLGLDQCDFLSLIGDSVKLGLLQSLMIAKPHGHFVSKKVFYTEPGQGDDGKEVTKLKKSEVKNWQPKIDLLRAEDYYPDPTGKGRYHMQEVYMDYCDVVEMSEGKDSIFEKSVVDQLSGGMQDTESFQKSRETNQNTSYTQYRKPVKIQEFWGDIIDISTGKMKSRGMVWAIANDRLVIMKPKENPLWHGDYPIVSAPFIRVPHSVWHKALMDAPTRTNMALNELYNLMVDSGMNAVHGIKQVRVDWLVDEGQIANGLFPGLAVKVNNQAPPGSKAIENVAMSDMSAEALNVFNMMSAEFSASSLTNDLRMGVMPNRAVKATEVVEASQSITSVFSGITKVIEVDYLCVVLSQLFKNQLQHLNFISRKELVDIWGENRVNEILAVPKEKIFAELAEGYTFKVYGVSRILAKQKDFKKIMALLQTLSTEPHLMEEFMKEYSVSKLLTEIMRSLDISVDRIKLTDEEKAQMNMGQAGQPVQMNAGPDMQSQIPQATSQESAETVESMIPRSDFGGLQGKANGGIQ